MDKTQRESKPERKEVLSKEKAKYYYNISYVLSMPFAFTGYLEMALPASSRLAQLSHLKVFSKHCEGP